jgi:hypothetical protein
MTKSNEVRSSYNRGLLILPGDTAWRRGRFPIIIKGLFYGRQRRNRPWERLFRWPKNRCPSLKARLPSTIDLSLAFLPSEKIRLHPLNCGSLPVLSRLATTMRAISESAAVALLQKRAGFRITLISRKGIELCSFMKTQFPLARGEIIYCTML